MTQLLKSPTAHVVVLGLLLGLALLIAVGLPTTGDEVRRVVVTASDLAHLRVAFMRTWQREPTPEELRGELESYLREEILYREAVARGYDKDDLVVRRAMQRKMEFLGQAQVALDPPSDEEIRAYYSLRQERYAAPAVVSFAQIYFSPERRKEVERDLDEALREVRLAQPEPDSEALARWGDAILLQSYYTKQPEPQIASVFGEAFAEALVDLETGEWLGPVRSGYGLHIVKVTERQEPRIPDWTEVRDRVVADMQYEAGNAGREQLFQEVAQRYRIVFDDTVQSLIEAAER